MAAVEHVPYTVSTADDLQNPTWTLQPHLIVTGCTFGVAPTLSQVNMLWRYGPMTRGHNDAPDEEMAHVAPLDLIDKFVKVEFEDAKSGKAIEWVGVVKDEIREQWNYVEEPSGDQLFTAYDLLYFLDRQQMSGRSSREADRAKRPYSYNTGAGDGREVDYTKRGNKDPDVYGFSFDADAVEWTAWDIAKHLLSEHAPSDADNNYKPVEFIIDSEAEPFLNWYKPTVMVEGRTLLQVLDEVISRRRGVVWWLEVKEIDGQTVGVVKVTSIAPDTVALPGGHELPAAKHIVTFDNIDEEVLLEPPQIKRDGARRYSRVRVRGARRTTTFSAFGFDPSELVVSPSFPISVHSIIEKTWSDEDEAEYLAGVRPILGDTEYNDLDEGEQADQNDRYRQGQRFEKVFRHFSINFQGGGQQESICPLVEQSTGSIVGTILSERRVVRLLQTTRFKAGYDYQDATSPTPRGDDDYGEELMRPVLFAYLPQGTGFVPTTLGEFTPAAGEGSAGTTDGGWRRAHDLNTHAETGFSVLDLVAAETTIDFRLKAAYGVAVLRNEPGFEVYVNGGMQHALLGPTPATLSTALADADGGEPSKYDCELRWKDLLITATAEWDCYCEAVWPTTVPSAEPIEELVIQLSDHVRRDWCQRGTVYDIDHSGNLKQVQTGGWLQDDAEICETIARLAYEWYGTPRASVTLTFRGTVIPFEIGDLVATIGSNAALQTINATVTQIQHDLENGGTVIHLGYAELDFSQLA